MMKLKKIVIYIIFIFSAFFFSNVTVFAKEVNVYMFYGKTCPHCEEALKYLNSIKDEHDLKIHKYEVWYNDDNKKLMKEIGDYLDINVSGIPFTIINNTGIIGYSSETTSETYLYHINKAKEDDFVDNVGIKLGAVKGEIKKQTSISKTSKTNKQKKEDRNTYKIKVPLLGKVNLKKLSLPVVAILIGTVDGFNPCAMWILLFLISTLIGMKDKKRLWILGSTFLISSALVYLAFMVSWLEFAKVISGIKLVRMAIALVALIGGILNLRSYIKSLGNADGCDVVNAKKRKKIFTKVRKFTHEKSFILAILGIILLAASVNIIELACSAGLPVIFTQLLAMNNLSGLEYALYIIIYIMFFMLDDFVIFFISIKTMELTGVSTKYSKFSHLIGGILMLLIGILLVLKPEWLMFNF